MTGKNGTVATMGEFGLAPRVTQVLEKPLASDERIVSLALTDGDFDDKTIMMIIAGMKYSMMNLLDYIQKNMPQYKHDDFSFNYWDGGRPYWKNASKGRYVRWEKREDMLQEVAPQVIRLYIYIAMVEAQLEIMTPLQLLHITSHPLYESKKKEERNKVEKDEIYKKRNMVLFGDKELADKEHVNYLP